MSSELFIVVGALLGLAAVWGVYKLRGGPLYGYIAASGAVILGAAIAIVGKTRKTRPFGWSEEKPTSAVEVAEAIDPIKDVAHANNEEVLESDRKEVDKAAEAESPEEALANLGNSRRRT